jgi:uncharacterized membrane protein
VEFAMSRKMSSVAKDKDAAKKAAVLGTPKKKLSPLLIILIALTVTAGGLIFFLAPPGRQANVAAGSIQPEITATEISFPRDAFNDGQARFFKYPADDGKPVRFFIIKSSDGVIRAAFDACDVCWPAGKGYYQEGDFMVCRNCGRRFASVQVNVVTGGCNPTALTRTVVGDKLVVKVEDVIKGRQYFASTREG